ncbi:opacity family porin [Pasteurella sp. PK-2025]|uniref:opacity family porin n=1 Tax=unclassified Pasteurella TaxID=2621516 RepID=UPI003C7219D2
MMKKSLLVLAMGTLFAATASANFYVQGDLGLSQNKFSHYSELNKTKFEPRLSFGYDFGALRLAADYTKYSNLSGNAKFKNVNEHVSVKAHGIGFSAFYDINVNSALTPYIGVRLSSNSFDIKNSGETFYRHVKTTKLGYGAIVGAQYELTSNVSLNANLEYNNLGYFGDTRVSQYGAKVGLRYEF